jgi:hypothetical protein
MSESADRSSVIRAVAGAVAPSRIEVRRPSLEDAFISIVAAQGEQDEATQLRAAVRDDAEGGLEVRR